MNSAKPSETRAPESKHTSASTSRDSWTSCSSKAAPRADEPRPKRQCRRKEKHVIRTTAIQDVDTNTKPVVLDCVNNPQPCLHYRSVIRHNQATAYDVNTCPYLGTVAGRGPDLAAKTDWEAQHPKNKWRLAVSDGGLIPNRRQGHELKGCEADEWPPYILYHEVDGYNRVIDPAFAARRAPINKPQFIRYLDGVENGKVGNNWRCKEIPQRHSTNSVTHSIVGNDETTTFFTDWTGVYTRTAYRIDPVVVDANNDDGIGANDCYPRGVNNDNRYQGYALLNNDPWYGDKQYQARYLRDPVNAKRSWLDPEDIVFVADNSSRRITDEEYEELQQKLGLENCSSGDCDGDDAMEGPVLIPTTLTAEVMQPTGTVPMPQDSAGDAKLPRETHSF